MNRHYHYIWEESRGRKLRRLIGNVLLTAGCVLIAWALIVMVFSIGANFGY